MIDALAVRPLYSARPEGLKAIGTVLAFVGAVYAAGCLTVGFATETNDTVVWWTSFVGTLAALLVIWLLMPRRYELLPDRLRIGFVLGLKRDVLYSTIEDFETPPGWQPIFQRGMRTATSPRNPLLIRRTGRGHIGRRFIVISPEEREAFARELEIALQRYRTARDQAPAEATAPA